MLNIWSKNRYVNLSVNILLFLMGINFLHYGQLILPVICFILFVDNRLRFRVNSPKTFIILCLFAVSFYAFSYQLGFYSVMGFTLPMAYYIGCNMKNNTEENVRKVILLLGVSMALHVVLNMIYEYIVHDPYHFFHSTSHYDFWTKEKISNTSTAINIDILLGCVYYLLFHEKNNKIKYSLIALFIVSMAYLMIIGRRTPVMMLLIVFSFSFFYEVFVLKNSSAVFRRNFMLLSGSAIAVVMFLAAAYVFDLFGYKAVLEEYHIIQKFTRGFINDQRLELFFGSFPLMPKYLWGGQHISAILGEQIHDFWIDIYDYAGIVPCVIMWIYSFIYMKNNISLFKSEKISSDFKIFVLGPVICIVLQMFLEPVMTGASLFAIVAVIINALFEKLLIDGK